MTDWTDLLAQLSPWAMLPLFLLKRRQKSSAPDLLSQLVELAKQLLPAVAPLAAKPNAMPRLAEILRALLAQQPAEQVPAAQAARDQRGG